MKSVLVVEDDQLIYRAITECLSENGYAVKGGRTLAEARIALQKEEFHLVLLDLNLPDGQSFELCRSLRAEWPAMPLVIITADLEENSAIKALSLGVTDYLRKPFGSRELLLRVRRFLAEKRGRIEIDRLVIDLDQRRASYGANLLSLSPRELDLLILLAENAGELVTREKILQKVDPDVSLSDKTLNSYLSTLRKKLKDAGFVKAKISPVYGTGYRLEIGE